MNFPLTCLDDPSTLLSHLASTYDPELSMEGGIVAPPALCDPCASSPTHPTAQDGLLFDPAESDAIVERSPLFPSTMHAPPPLACCSAWQNAPPGDTRPPLSFPFSAPSEHSVYAAEHAPEGNVAVANGQGHKTRRILPHTPVSTSTSGQATPAQSHPEHVVSWFHVCWNAVIVNGPRAFVPQTIYQPHSQGDKERYVSLATLHPPIIFLAQDSLEWGIPIQHLLSGQLVSLVEGDEPAFVSCGPSVCIRVQWPGYRPCHKQVATRDYTHKRHRISKTKLAKVVAKCVKQFMDSMSRQEMQVGSDTGWRVGPLGVRVDDVVLVSLHHVSQGSWQPQLRIISADAVAGL